MSFNLTYPPMTREQAAQAVRNGDHHRKGEHTFLDKRRESIAEQIEQTGQAGAAVRVSVVGHHDETGSYLAASVQVVPTQHGAEMFDAPSDLLEREEELA